MHLFICFFVMEFVRKMGARPGLAIESFIPFNVQKWTFCLIRLLSSINDDFKRGCVTRDHSFMHGRFPIQHITTAFERILFSSMVMVLAYGARDPCFEFCPNLIFLPRIYSFVSLFQTLYVRLWINFQYMYI